MNLPNSLRSLEGESPQAPLPAHGTTSKPDLTGPQGKTGESLPSNSTRVMLLQLAEKRRHWVTEIAALELAIKRIDELVMALQALEKT